VFVNFTKFVLYLLYFHSQYYIILLLIVFIQTKNADMQDLVGIVSEEMSLKSKSQVN